MKPGELLDGRIQIEDDHRATVLLIEQMRSVQSYQRLIGIPDCILLMPGKLEAEEWAVM